MPTGNEQLKFRAEPDLAQAIKAAAQEAGLPLSQWLRDAVTLRLAGRRVGVPSGQRADGLDTGHGNASRTARQHLRDGIRDVVIGHPESIDAPPEHCRHDHRVRGPKGTVRCQDCPASLVNGRWVIVRG